MQRIPGSTELHRCDRGIYSANGYYNNLGNFLYFYYLIVGSRNLGFAVDDVGTYQKPSWNLFQNVVRVVPHYVLL